MSTPSTVAGNGFSDNAIHPVEYRRVYVWELPVRVYHWINAVALVVLCVTGYLIGAPLRAFYAAEAYQQYWFGWVRFLHFLAAFVYVFNFAARLYWGFVGNKYSHWNAFFPLKKSQQQEIVDVIKADVLETKMLHGAQRAGRPDLLRHVSGICFPDHHRLRSLFQHEQLVAATDVYLDCAADGRGIRRALLAPSFPVVLCHICYRSRVSCLLSRLHRGARYGILDHWRMEVRSGEEWQGREQEIGNRE
jgi:hypothetical protein